MPYPGAGFPIPPFAWPHVGRQWPAYNVESDQADGLMAWWPTLASRGATSLRDLVNGEAATFNGNPTWCHEPLLGPVLVYDGTGDYLTTGFSWNGTDNFTIAVWGMRSAAENLAGGFLCNNGEADGFGLIKQAANVCFHTNSSGGDDYLYPDANPALDTLFHLVGVLRNGTKYIYLNGVLQTNTSVHTPDAATRNFILGSKHAHWLGSLLNGQIGGTRFYNRPFADTDVWQLYDPATRWELPRIPRHLWRLGAIAPPPATIVPIAMRHYRSMRV